MAIVWKDGRRFSQNPKDPQFYQNPYALYQQLHARGGPVYWEDYNMWCLTGFADVDKCLRDRRFARLPPAGYDRKHYANHLQHFAATEEFSLLALEPPQHTRLRRLVNRAFVSRQVESMADEIRQLTHQCIDQFEADGSVELLSRFATPVPVTVIARLLGVPESDTDKLLGWSHAMVRIYTLTQTLQEEHAAEQAATEFRAYLKDLISERRLTPQHDLLSHLVAQQDTDDPLSDEEIISITILLLNAGHEATVHQLGNSVVNLLRNPPDDKRWWSKPELVSSLVDECLRYDAPLHLFTRFAQEQVVLADDVTIEAGTEIALLLGAANRCPVAFGQADQFVPDRPDANHVTLGAGVHFCVGAPLARLELRIALSVLFERLPGMSLAEEPVYQNSFHFHGLESLRVSW